MMDLAIQEGREADRAARLLCVQDLRVTFTTAHGRIEAVQGVSLDIAVGEILALVGESGSGKSVTARALVGLAGPRAEVEADELSLIARDGGVVDLLRLTSGAWRQVRGREIGFVLQDALVSLDPLRTVGREIAEPILAHNLVPKAAVNDEVRTLLVHTGVPEPEVRAAQYPHELSGGLRQRALIASALAARPRLLIADEPTTALDVTVQQQILGVFQDLARAGHGLLLITHDLAVAAQVASRIAVMRQGRIVEAGPTHEVLTAPAVASTRGLLAAVPCAARGKVPPARGALTGAPLLEIENVSVNFRRPDGGTLAALEDVSCFVRPGETLGVVGESGSGKTTLGRVALALQQPHQGEVRFEDQPWSRLPESARRPLRPRMQAVVQDPLSSFDPRFTVERIIAQPLRLRDDLGRAARRRRVTELIERVGLPAELLSRRPGALSGGQRQRVSIAQALASEPRLLICDEPVSSLDVTTQAQILELLSALQRRMGLAMLFISHDLGVIQQVSHRIAVMQAGRIVETEAAADLFSRPQHPYTQRLLGALPRLPEWV